MNNRFWISARMVASWASGRQIFQASNVIMCPVQSIHLRIGNPNVREDLNRTVFCINNAFNTRKPVKLMRTPMQVNKGSRSCHFVPLLEVVMKLDNM